MTAPDYAPSPIHATCVARRGPGGWTGVLLTGPSGAGKSDMALRVLHRGWRLVSDDYCRVWKSSGDLWAAPPDGLRSDLIGGMEVRGLGIVAARATRPHARIGLVVSCGQIPVERLPDPDFATLAEVRLPRLLLDVRPASAVLVLEAAVARISVGLPLGLV